MRDFISQRVKELQPSATVRLMSLAKQMKEEGQDIINLAGGEPDFKTPSPIIERAYTDMKAGFTSYIQSQGLPELRRKLAQKLQVENHIDAVPEGILVTASTKLALFIGLFTCLQAGDEALYFEPAYVSYKPIIELTGAKAIGIPLSYEDNYQIRKSEIERFITPQTKAIILCSPNNPTGRVCQADELKAIAEVACERDLLIFSDEIYERIIFSGFKHISPASLPELKGRVITLNGFQKPMPWPAGVWATSLPIRICFGKWRKSSSIFSTVRHPSCRVQLLRPSIVKPTSAACAGNMMNGVDILYRP